MPVTVLVKKCRACCIVFQVTLCIASCTIHHLTHNIFSHKRSALSTLVTLYLYPWVSNSIVTILNNNEQYFVSDIVFLLRGLVHQGTPLANVAETLIENISYRNKELFVLQRTQKDWLCRLLTAGYLAMESLDDDEETGQICGLCGIIPEVVLGENALSLYCYVDHSITGDGGEDVCCVLESWHLEREDTASGVFPASYTDTFLNNLKCFFVEALVFPRAHMSRRLVSSYCVAIFYLMVASGLR